MTANGFDTEPLHEGGRAYVANALAATPGPIRIFKTTGNSSSIGCQGKTGKVVHAQTPSFLRPYGFMFNPGPAASGPRGLGASKLRPEVLSEFVPIFERSFPERPPGETHGVGMLAWIAWRRAALSLSQELMLYRANGAAGKNLSQISKGSQPYENGLTELRAARNIAASYNKDVICEDCFVANGTQDRTQGATRSQFLSQLEQLSRDHNRDWVEITGQAAPVRTWIAQLSANFSPARAHGSDIPLAQLDFVRSNPLARMVGPRYVFWYDDIVHFQASRGYVWESEYFAKAWLHEKVVGRWKALGEDVSTSLSGKSIDIVFDRGGLRFDTTTLPAAPNYGFSVDSGAERLFIETVSIESSRLRDDTVRLTLANKPHAVDELFWSYAFDGPGATARIDAGCPGAGAWGNLCDSDATPSRFFTGETLPNWCVITKKRVLPLHKAGVETLE